MQVSGLDWLFVVAMFGLTAVWLVQPRPFHRFAFGVVGLLAVTTAAVIVFEGPLWQAPAAAPLILLLMIAAWRGWTARGAWRTVGVIIVALIAAGPWLIAPPVPALAKPTGPFALGSRTFRWVDPSRAETLTADPTDHRNVVAQAWYPAAPNVSGRHEPYIDGLGHLPSMVSLFPGFMMQDYGRIDTHAVGGASMSGAKPWPVVLFSPGYGAPRAAYTGLVTELASRGYVVVTLDHPYEGPVVQLADGKLALPAPIHGDVDAYMVTQQDVRAADLSFALDRLLVEPSLAGHIDPTRIYAIGHSFGGPSAVLAMTRDLRIKAAANLDGTPYGVLPDLRLDRPFLLIESDPAETHHGQSYLDGNARLLAQSSAPVGRKTIARANHYSFTDAYLFLSPPTRWAAIRLVGGGLGPVATQRLAVDDLVEFLDAPTPP